MLLAYWTSIPILQFHTSASGRDEVRFSSKKMPESVQDKIELISRILLVGDFFQKTSSNDNKDGESCLETDDD